MEHFPTLTETVTALRSGEVTSEELTRRTLARIMELDDHLGAFVHVAADAALDRARAADESLAATRDMTSGGTSPGSEVPALLGVPTALKDGHDVAGMPTTWGSLTTRGESGAVPPAAASDPLAATLEASGAVIVGKTQVPEFLLNCYSENRAFPPARNPFALECSPGGSSGGQAAAVAAGILPGAVGSDGGGSIRIPAAACGLIGLKPNRGRVPSNDALSNVGQLGVNGPITRTARDAALLMDALCHTPGHDRIDRPVRAAPEPSFTAVVDAALAGRMPWGERPLRIGVSTASPFDDTYDISVSPEARAALDDGVRRLEYAGHDVVDARISYDPTYPDAFFRLWSTVMGQLPLTGQEGRLTGLARAFRERALSRSAVDLAESVATLRRIEASVLGQYARYDMILTPALAMPPRPIGWFHEGFDIADPAGAEQDYMRQCQYTPWTSLINVVGLPAITVPTTWATPEGGDYPGPVPMGVHLVGAASSEAWLLALAAQLDPPTTPRASLVA